jgi:NAD(P)-dependent dehydrogenase (short-subunit alcohol dehydrogenase family)
VTSLFVITGVNRGLGLALTSEAVGRGLHVIGVERGERSEAVPPEVEFTRLDCSSPNDVAEFWQMLRQRWADDPDLTLINNAGKFYRGAIADTDIQTIQDTLADNYLAAVTMSLGLLQHFGSGTIVNLNSYASLKPRPGLSAYSAAKAAQRNFFDTLRQELTGGSFRITNLYPYRINTWSSDVEPETIDKGELARWIVDTALLRSSFVVTDCTLLPADSHPNQPG